MAFQTILNAVESEVKLFIAALATETNTFSACPSGLLAYSQFGLFRGNASSDQSGKSPWSRLLAIWRSMGEERGYEVVESISAFAQPGGRTPNPVYERFRSEILEDLSEAAPVDVVLLSLHGAMAADDYDDCEGDLLQHVRAAVGDRCVIGAELDLHCHTTEAMLTNADLLVAYKEYPHSDIGRRGVELFQLCHRAHVGEVKPVMRAYDCNMIDMWRTRNEPVRGFVDRMMALERDDPEVLSVSFGHGFPWADVEQVGAKTWAITDDNPARAEAIARDLGEELIAMRDQNRFEALTIDQAIDAAEAAADGCTVIADITDNAGGGAMSDSTFVLQRFLDRGVTDAALGVYWDLTAVDLCINGGIGSELDVRLGGKCGPCSGNPIDLRATVRNIREDYFQSGLGGHPTPMGTAIWLETQGLDLVLCSIRTQTFHPDALTGLGIDLDKKRMVVVKSQEHFSAGFAPIAAQILYVDAPGSLRHDFANIPYTQRDVRYWPRSEAPEGRPFP